MIFWALAQRKKDREKIEAAARAKGMVEGRAEGIAEGRAEGIAEGRVEGRAEERDRIVQEMLDHGIEVPPEILVGHADRE